MAGPEMTATDIINAIGTHLSNQKVAYWPGLTGTYPKTSPIPPVFAKRLPPTPVTAFAINVYHITPPAPDETVWRYRVQIRSRAPLNADANADKALNVLHAIHNQTWGGVHVARVLHESTAQLGADPSTGVDERTDNYLLEVTT